MRKIVKLILKSDHIKRRFLERVKFKIKKIREEKQKLHNEEQELDDHNDSSNWSYS
jgi:hypothetical protein